MTLLPSNKFKWISRNRLMELLQEVPQDAVLRTSPNGNLTFMTDTMTGYIDLAEEIVEALPDHEI